MSEILKSEFGDLAGVTFGGKRGYSCLHFALHNATLALYIGLNPKIVWVNTPTIESTRSMHAHFTDGDALYSYGWTWPTKYFKELSKTKAFLLGGKDVTKIIFWQALQIVDDRTHNYHEVLVNLESLIPGIIGVVAGYYDN